MLESGVECWAWALADALVWVLLGRVVGGVRCEVVAFVGCRLFGFQIPVADVSESIIIAREAGRNGGKTQNSISRKKVHVSVGT